MNPVQVLEIAVVVLMAGVAAVWRLPGVCRCPQCHIHVAEREKEQAAHKERQHDFHHKGMGYKASSPDRYHCPDEKCARNPKRVD